MAGPYRGRMSENDMLIEMRRLRDELGDVRARVGRSSSFRRDGPTARQLRNRAAIGLLSALAVAVGLLCWMLYELLANTVGLLFDDLLPHPVRATVRALAQVAALFF